MNCLSLRGEKSSLDFRGKGLEKMIVDDLEEVGISSEELSNQRGL